VKLRLLLLGPDDDPSEDPLVRQRAETAHESWRVHRYEKEGAGIVRVEQQASGRTKTTPVANFSARIVRDLILDDGDEQERHFSLEAELSGQTVCCSVSATEFSRMGWVHKLGPQATIYPGQQQYARAAIQWLSGEIPQEHISSHLGWRKSGRDWVYLHAADAQSAGGINSGLKPNVPAALQSYQVRSLKDPGEVIRAVRASLDCLSLAPDRISFPLLTAVYRAPFGEADFSVFLAGRSGVFKTALAALCQQHFGAAMDVICPSTSPQRRTQ
jgi:hypothetical protein